jgi:hypothetical protein
MTTVLFSLPVHESNETIRDTIANLRRFNGPDHPIMIHVDANWQGFDDTISALSNVHVNPQRWHTRHAHSQIPTHVSNFQRANELQLDFTHMAIVHTSELFVRQGMPTHIEPYAHSLWFTPDTQPIDPNWPPMIMAKQIWPGFASYLGNLVEGSWYSRQLFSDMVRFICGHHDLPDLVMPWALEECLFPSLTWHLTRGAPHAHPYCAFQNDVHYVNDTGFVDDIRAGQPVTFWQPHNFVYDYAPFASQGLFSVKRVSRDLSDPVRCYIRQLGD